MGEGSKTIGRVNIRGPVIIGKDCTIGPNVYIGPYTSIGDECILKNTEIENSIVMRGCRIESGKRIVDSLIGNYSTVINSNASIPQGHRLIIGERSFAQL
jgi:glucose-1-phosphate thymidylyltransferase